MDDPARLLERLRKHPAFWLNGATWVRATGPEPVCQEAADWIEQALEVLRTCDRAYRRDYPVDRCPICEEEGEIHTPDCNLAALIGAKAAQ